MEDEENCQFEEIEFQNQNEEEQPEQDFLEVSLISEIKQTIEQLDSKCQDLEGEELVETRCRQLSYVRVLVDVYQKDPSLLIMPTAYLGEAYFYIHYYEQAQEHFEATLKLNEGRTVDNGLNGEYLLKISIKLSRCYLETERLEACLVMTERTLEMNKKVYKEKHISFVEIYTILYELHKKLGNYEKSIEYLNYLSPIYEDLYGTNSPECADTLKQLAEIYELWGDLQNSINYYLKYVKTMSSIAKEEKDYEIFFQIAIRIASLYIIKNEGNKAYEVLKSTENIYGNKIKRSIKNRSIYQKCVIKACSSLKNLDLYLDEFFRLEAILKESNENQKQLAKAFIAIGYIYLQKNDKDKCILYYKMAEEIVEKHKDFQLLKEIKDKIKAAEKEETKYEENYFEAEEENKY